MELTHLILSIQNGAGRSVVCVSEVKEKGGKVKREKKKGSENARGSCGPG